MSANARTLSLADRFFDGLGTVLGWSIVLGGIVTFLWLIGVLR